MRLSPAIALALSLSACPGEPRPTLDDVSADLRIDSLPPHARVSVDGRDIGPTPIAIHLVKGAAYQLNVALPGFQPRTFGGSAELLLQSRSIEVVLAPQGYGAAAPRGDDVAGLTSVAEELQRRKDHVHAIAFWERVVQVAPRDARAHRGLGSSFAKLGEDERAIQEYTKYLFLAPDAHDAARVQRAIDAYRGGIQLPGSGLDEN